MDNGRFLIIDYVITTSATANEYAKTLITKGATAIKISTLTRGMPLDYACSKQFGTFNIFFSEH